MALQQPSALAWVSEVGEEKEGVGKRLYLITFSRLLLDTSDVANADLRDFATLSREQVGIAVREAFNDPLPPQGGGGRPFANAGGVVRTLRFSSTAWAAMFQLRKWNPDGYELLTVTHALWYLHMFGSLNCQNLLSVRAYRHVCLHSLD